MEKRYTVSGTIEVGTKKAPIETRFGQTGDQAQELRQRIRQEAPVGSTVIVNIEAE